MRQYPFIAAIGIVTALVWPAAARAQLTTTETKAEERAEETTATKEATEEAKETTQTRAESRVVTQRLASEFNVDESRVQNLRNQGLGYGEVRHALSLAQQMPGGINDDNVNQIMKMRQEQHMGWGQIAHQLGAKLGPARTQPRAAALPAPATSSTTPPAVQPPTHPGGGASAPFHPGQSNPGHHGGSFNRPGGGNHQSVAIHSRGGSSGVHGHRASVPGHSR